MPTSSPKEAPKASFAIAPKNFEAVAATLRTLVVDLGTLVLGIGEPWIAGEPDSSRSETTIDGCSGPFSISSSRRWTRGREVLIVQSDGSFWNENECADSGASLEVYEGSTDVVVVRCSGRAKGALIDAMTCWFSPQLEAPFRRAVMAQLKEALSRA